MIPTVTVLLAVSAFVTTIIGMLGKCPWWVPVLLLCVLALLQSAMPLGK